MGLTASQQEKEDEIVSLLLQGEKRINLVGSAGVGKTFLVNSLINRITKIGLKGTHVYVTAPTHKALNVLKGKIDISDKPFVEFKTIHSGLQLKRTIDRKTGKQTFKPGKYNTAFPIFNKAMLIIVDEASMLPSDLLFAEGGINDYPSHIYLFIGDHKQLPPIGERISPIFTQNYPTVKLTEIIRQKGNNPIIELSNNLSLIATKVNSFNDVGDGYLFDNNQQYIIDKLAEVNGTDDIKYLSYTNAEVIKINNLVRNKIYGLPQKVELNETLIFEAPHIGNNLSYKNNQEVKVLSVRISTKKLFIPNSKSKVQIGENRTMITNGVFDTTILKTYIVNEDFHVLHEESLLEFSKTLNFIQESIFKGANTWLGYYYFLEQLASISYNHAITVHKSQGSTYNTSIINIKDINNNRNVTEKHSMLYTAITRSSNKVVLYNT